MSQRARSPLRNPRRSLPRLVYRRFAQPRKRTLPRGRAAKKLRRRSAAARVPFPFFPTVLMLVAIFAATAVGAGVATFVLTLIEALAVGDRAFSAAFNRNAGSATTAGIVAIAYLAALPVTLVALQYLGGRDFFRGLFRPLRRRDVLTVAAAVVASIAVDAVYAYGLERLGQGGHRQAGFEVFHAIDWTDRIVDLLSICVVGPVVEELLFRGLLLAAFERWFGLVPAIILSSVLFGLAHGDPVLFGDLFASGLILAMLFKRTKTLYASMAVHATINLLTTLVWFATR